MYRIYTPKCKGVLKPAAMYYIDKYLLLSHIKLVFLALSLQRKKKKSLADIGALFSFLEGVWPFSQKNLATLPTSQWRLGRWQEGQQLVLPYVDGLFCILSWSCLQSTARKINKRIPFRSLVCFPYRVTVNSLVKKIYGGLTISLILSLHGR